MRKIVKLEESLGVSLWKLYSMIYVLLLSDNNVKFDVGDVITGIVVFAIIAINIIGSLYDVYYTSNEHKDKHILLSFSIKRNWRTLTAKKDPDQYFKCLNGLKCIISYGVILVHCMWPFVLLTENVHDLELSFNDMSQYIIYNGSILIQTFFVISGLLLAYKMKIHSEKHKVTWSMVPKAIFMRYIRLTPAFAVIIMLLSTWLKFIGPGPLWEETGNMIMLNCKKNWWLSLLYLNNYVYDYQCMLPYWYLATDMQLFCFGLIVCVLLSKNRFKRAILIALFVAGIIIVAAHTYIRDLPPQFLIVLSEGLTMFKTDPSFNESYKTGHANISSYVIGLALGFCIYRCQKNDEDFKKYSKTRYIYWIVLPLIIGLVLTGSVFYRDAPRDPLYIRVLYAAFAKPVMGILMAVLILGMIFKLENVYRIFLEWDVWTILSKLTYGIYIIHFFYILIFINAQRSLIHLSLYTVLAHAVCITIISYLTALPLYLLVEAPINEFMKYLVEQPRQDKVATNDQDKTNL